MARKEDDYLLMLPSAVSPNSLILMQKQLFNDPQHRMDWQTFDTYLWFGPEDDDVPKEGLRCNTSWKKYFVFLKPTEKANHDWYFKLSKTTGLELPVPI